MKHVVLLGDFDLRQQGLCRRRARRASSSSARRLPSGWTATLAARDGSTTADIKGQLKACPQDATHLVVCVGGNDALRHKAMHRGEGAARWPRCSTSSPRSRPSSRRTTAPCSTSCWRRSCRPRSAPSTRRATRIPTRARSRRPGSPCSTTSSLREAFARGLPLIDLRLIFDDDADYANDIEPSVKAAPRSPSAIATLVTTHDFTRRRSEIYVLASLAALGLASGAGAGGGLTSALAAWAPR